MFLSIFRRLFQYNKPNLVELNFLCSTHGYSLSKWGITTLAINQGRDQISSHKSHSCTVKLKKFTMNILSSFYGISKI